MSMDKMFADFADPGCSFRGAPFWAWNGAMEPEELRRQVRLMKKMGLGGFFMHSRVGLDTPYLGPEWFECIGACIDEAKRQGMGAWLYDEDRWPSGAAGGLVTRDPTWRMRRLVMRRGRKPLADDEGELLAVFAVRFDGDRMSAYRRLPPDSAGVSGGEELLTFHVETAALSSWYNGQTYLDTLDREAVARFLEVTHEAYRRHAGGDFGAAVPGIFTDEPNYGRVLEREGENRLLNPWSRRLPEVFTQRYGYDLADYLPELYFDAGSAGSLSLARYHYYDCLTHMFVDAFGRQIGEWCAENNLLYTGHLLEEDSLRRQVTVVGNCMRFYEHMQAPGMDLLTERWRAYDTAKQVSSAAAQFGRKWRLSETYGCTGWDFPFAGHKALGDWQAALGINLRCQHLAWYTMLGEAKRDYPASIFYQSPWWRDYRRVEDYFARIFAVMTRGREVRDILVIHPVESMWTMASVGWEQRREVRDYDEMIVTLCNSLLAAHLDFDYGDEEILSRHGRNGERGGEPVLLVGQGEYRAVVVPPLRTIRSSTLELLREFRDRGGEVIFMGEPPRHVDARISARAAELAAGCECLPPPSLPADSRLLERLGPVARRISIRDEEGEIPAALYLLREDDDACYLFVCNTGHDADKVFCASPLDKIRDDDPVRDRRREYPRVIVEAPLSAGGHPLQLDPQTGAVNRAAATRTAGGWKIETGLPVLGSRLFVFPRAATGGFPRLPAFGRSQSSEIDPGKWEIALTEDNVAVLDRPALRIDGGRRQEPAEILRVDKDLRRRLGVPPRGGRMVQPWLRSKTRREKTIRVELAYHFEIDSLPRGEVFLGIEKPETFAIELNGNRADPDTVNGWWCDRSMSRIPLSPEWFRRGVNRLTLVVEHYGESHPGLEIVYLLGDFGVRIKDGVTPVLTALPGELRTGDWVRQGLPFYSGAVVYRTAFRSPPAGDRAVFIVVPAYSGTAVRVLVNGREAGLIAWPPNEVEVTGLLAESENTLELVVMSHRRNSHGPLHLAESDPRLIGPFTFVREGEQWSEEYRLVPCGLDAPPRLEVRRRHDGQ